MCVAAAVVGISRLLSPGNDQLWFAWYMFSVQVAGKECPELYADQPPFYTVGNREGRCRSHAYASKISSAYLIPTYYFTLCFDRGAQSP